jgi:tetratricopeptide (TPR) repeat protein
MKSLFQEAILLFAGAVLLASCSSDPNTRKLKYLHSGEKYNEAGKYQEAVIEFRNAEEVDPRFAAAHYQLGRAYLAFQNYGPRGAAYRAAGQLSKAEDAYRAAIQKNAKSAAAREALSQFLFSVDKLAKAEGEMRAACDLDSHAISPRIFLARIYLAMGRTTDAEATYAALKRITPNNPEAYQALGTFYVSTGQKEKAVAEFHALVKAHPKDASIEDSLAETLLDLNRIADATPVVHESLRANSVDPRGLLSHGRILLAQGAYDKSVEALQKGVKAAPNSATANYLLGVAQQAAHFPALAKASFDRTLELQPHMALAAGALAGLDAATGDYAEASRQADKAHKADPNLLSANLASARALIAKGDLHQAETVLDDGLKRDPASPATFASHLNLYIRQGRGQDAVRRFADLVQQYPQSAGLHCLLGLAYFNVNNLQQAEAIVWSALNLDPKTPDAHTVLANIALASGSVEEAKADFRTAIADFPAIS